MFKMAKKKNDNVEEVTENTLEEKIVKKFEKSQTFNPLIAALRENDKKNLFSTNVTTAFLKTGFPLFDYYFGSVVNIHNELGEIIEQQSRVGQAVGTFNLFIGGTGSGKSTIAAQLASNIVRPYKYGSIIHFDAEQRMDLSRLENITRLPHIDFQDNGRYILKSGFIGLDTIQEMIVKIYGAKMQNAKELTIELPYTDEFNQQVRILQPTVIIIDSITSVINETFSVNNEKEFAEAQQLQSNTEGARSAKTIKGFFKDMLPLCKEANIIIYAINHINTNMSMNAFVQPTKQQMFLKQDESIPGGKILLYYPYNIVKLIAKPSDSYSEEKDGFAGHLVTIEPIKSSSNQSGNSNKGVNFDLVFSYKNGFDSLRSLIVYGRNKGLIEGNKTRYTFKGSKNKYGFNWANLNEEVNKYPIWEDIKEIIIPSLKEKLPFVEHFKFDDRSMDY